MDVSHVSEIFLVLVVAIICKYQGTFQRSSLCRADSRTVHSIM